MCQCGPFYTIEKYELNDVCYSRGINLGSLYPVVGFLVLESEAFGWESVELFSLLEEEALVLVELGVVVVALTFHFFKILFFTFLPTKKKVNLHAILFN